MKKGYLIISVFLIFSISGFTQQWRLKRMEAQFGMGTTNIYGDLGGAPGARDMLFIKDITFRSTRPSVYIGIRYRINPRIALKTSFIYGYSKIDDNGDTRNELRGFTSTTHIFEFAGNLEYYFISEQRSVRSAAIFNRRGMLNNYSSFAAYVFAGLGASIYRPDLQILAPRPNDEYKYNMGITPSIPVGLGIKYILSDEWIIGYEVAYHQTLTDFLDGFKPPSSNWPDIYWISTLNLTYRIPTSRRGIPIFLDREWRRARF